MRHNNKEAELIWESYITEREYGPSGAPSLDVSTWKLQDFYRLDEWEDVSSHTSNNPWTKYVHKTLDDLSVDQYDENETEYVTFFGPVQGSTDYEAWTDPGIVVSFHNVDDHSIGIFADNDGEGEAHVLAPEIIETLVKNNIRVIDMKMSEDRERRRSEAEQDRY